MIDPDELSIVHYCHANCAPLKNIMRLPKEEAFALARSMARDNAETTAFYRFVDFQHYYPRRMEVDRLLYRAFRSLGGKPQTEHPLSFVLQGSKFLHKWFDCGSVIRIPLRNIPSEYISFTYGDSMAAFGRDGKIPVVRKEELLEVIGTFPGRWMHS